MHDDTPGLVPELLVSHLPTSLDFYLGLCGFQIKYARPEEHFAYLCKGRIHLMLDQIDPADANRNWITGEMTHPFGRGINLEMGITDLDAVYQRIQPTPHLYRPMEAKWYRAGDVAIGVRQFLCQDPDGYLLRFQQDIGSNRLPRE